MLNELTRISVQMLLQIKGLMEQLEDEQYSGALELLSGNTIAKHIRHVLEIYEELLNGYAQAQVNYDVRKRNLLLEQNRLYALQHISVLSNKLGQLQEDKTIKLIGNYGDTAPDVQVTTTIGRELAYNIEHAIHHMAILQIAVRHVFPAIKLDAGFGVAYSTQIYRQQHVHA